MNKTKHRKSGPGFRAGKKGFSSNKPTKSTESRFNKGNKNKYRKNNKRGGRKIPTFDPSLFINKNPIEIKPDVYTPQNNFSTFGLNEGLVKTVTSLGITTPSPIQDQIIPEIIKGNDVVGLAETGTGKTAAFLLPLINRTIQKDSERSLILAPTRELAIQIQDELKKLTKGFKIFSVICVGGMNIRPQISGLKRKNHFVIGTPGRMLDLIKRGNFRPDNITSVVLDEADRMLDMGFIGDMKSILSTTPKNKSTLFFSATMPDSAKKIVDEFLNKPTKISVKKKDVTDSIEQDIVAHKDGDKFDKLIKLFNDESLKRVIIFGGMKHSVEKLSKDLVVNKIKSVSIHGNKNHGQRQRALNDFKSGQARVLVATDVAARGIHVDNVTHVINYDLPQTFEDYVHRIGRTGRGEKRGKALTFVKS